MESTHDCLVGVGPEVGSGAGGLLGAVWGRRDDGRDLVVIALSRVQRFISESRTTSDLSSASEMVARLAVAAARVCSAAGPDAQVGLPVDAETPTGDGSRDGGAVGGGDRGAGAAWGGAAVPNRVVALVPAGRGRAVAADAAMQVARLWGGWVRQALGREVETSGCQGAVGVRPGGPG
jgi:CRISPR-associated protein Cmr2